jgi:hypothetical protein
MLAEQEPRVIHNDWTVRWRNRFLQLPAETAADLQPGEKITVCEQLDGQVRLFHDDRELSWSATRVEPSRSRKKTKKPAGEIRSSQGQKPAADHPWRGRPLVEGETVPGSAKGDRPFSPAPRPQPQLP